MTAAAGAPSSITVWGAGTPRTLRVYWALHELEVPYRRMVVRTRTADTERADFRAVSSSGKIPALEHAGLKLTESGAIVAYLFEQFDTASRDAAWTARVARWSYFALTELDATALYVIRRHSGLPKIYGEAPLAVAAAREYFQRMIACVDEVLQDGHRFILGTVFSAADIHLGSCCLWAQATGLVLPAAVERYLETLRSRPAFEAAWLANQLPD